MKFESGTGWPSFYAPVARENLREEVDDSLFMRRSEWSAPRALRISGMCFPMDHCLPASAIA